MTHSARTALIDLAFEAAELADDLDDATTWICWRAEDIDGDDLDELLNQLAA